MSKNVKVPSDYILMSNTSIVKRYWTPTIKALANEMMEAQETRSGTLSYCSLQWFNVRW